MLNTIRSAIVFLFLIAFCASSMAATSIPFTFAAGTAAKASEVNTDFQALATAIDTLSTRVSKLEGTSPITASDLAGIYTLNGNEVTLGTVDIQIVSYQATVTLASNGNGTITNNSSAGYQLVFGPPLTKSTTGGAIADQSFTWSLSGSSVTMLGSTFSIVSGGRLLIESYADAGKGSNVLTLLTRN